MEEYVKRSDVLNNIEDLKKSPWYNNDYGFGTKQARHDGVDIVVDLCIKDVPAADVKKVIHGKWLDDYGYDKCSVCGFKCNDPYYLGEANYCPECGARMDLD